MSAGDLVGPRATNLRKLHLAVLYWRKRRSLSETVGLVLRRASAAQVQAEGCWSYHYLHRRRHKMKASG
jgi:hypothetical protein